MPRSIASKENTHTYGVLADVVTERNKTARAYRMHLCKRSGLVISCTTTRYLTAQLISISPMVGVYVLQFSLEVQYADQGLQNLAHLPHPAVYIPLLDVSSPRGGAIFRALRTVHR